MTFCVMSAADSLGAEIVLRLLISDVSESELVRDSSPSSSSLSRPRPKTSLGLVTDVIAGEGLLRSDRRRRRKMLVSGQGLVRKDRSLWI